MKLETLQLINLLIQAVPKMAASELVQKCHDLGMIPQPYQQSPADSNLPEFDEGHQFRFETHGAAAAGFDILEKEGVILQAGFQIFFRRAFFICKSKKYYNSMVAQLEQHYGSGSLMKTSGVTISNYGDPRTVCYISKAKALGKDLITIRVGNRLFWN